MEDKFQEKVANLNQKLNDLMILMISQSFQINLLEEFFLSSTIEPIWAQTGSLPNASRL